MQFFLVLGWFAACAVYRALENPWVSGSLGVCVAAFFLEHFRRRVYLTWKDRIEALESRVEGLQDEIGESQGISMNRVEVGMEAHCPVCRGAITENVAHICPSCEVLYHTDCWEFVRSCAVFGCRERK